MKYVVAQPLKLRGKRVEIGGTVDLANSREVNDLVLSGVLVDAKADAEAKAKAAADAKAKAEANDQQQGQL